MALEKSEVNDKLEIVDVGSWKVLQVRTATVIKDDGIEISRNFHRRVISPTDDWSSEDTEIKFGTWESTRYVENITEGWRDGKTGTCF